MSSTPCADATDVLDALRRHVTLVLPSLDIAGRTRRLSLRPRASGIDLAVHQPAEDDHRAANLGRWFVHNDRVADLGHILRTALDVLRRA